MNLIIKLPPKAERDDIVKSWVIGVKDGTDFSEFKALLQNLVESGHHHNGITCLFLHDTTTKLIRQQLAKEVNSPWIEAAFRVPISLN